ncbi:MAG: PAS domain-containing protein [Methylotenera sp.]|nr:PAS domain-containing protein [Oligoflexia bacterium]
MAESGSQEEIVNILLVDDLPENLLVLDAVLRNPGYRLLKAASGTEALKLLEQHDCAVILLDVQMPTLDGYGTALLVRKIERARTTPIIFVTALHRDDDYARKGYQVGAVDYLFKPLDSDTVRAKVSIFVELYRARQQIQRHEREKRDLEYLAEKAEMQSLERATFQKYKDLVDSMSHSIIWSADSDTLRFTFVSAQAEQITGFPAETWLEDGEFWANHLHPSDRSRVLDLFRQLAGNRNDVEMEHRFQRANGSILWFHTGIRLTPKSPGPGFELRGLSVDVSQMKRAEEEKLKSEAQLRLITNAVPALVSYIDRDQRYRFVNQTYFDWFRYRNDEDLLGKSMKEVMSAESYEKSRSPIAKALAGEKIQFDNTVSNSEGKIRHLQVNYVPDFSEEGQVRGVVVIGHDITQLKETEQALEKSFGQLEVGVRQRTEELYLVNKELKKLNAEQITSAEVIRQSEVFLDSLIQNIPNMIFVKEAHDLRFVRLNKAGEELLGVSQSELLGKNDHDLFPSEEANAFISKDRAVLAGKGAIDIPEETISTKVQGTRVLHTRKIPIFDHEGNPQYLLGISEDVTENKVQEAQRLNLIQEQAARVEAEKAASRLSFLAETGTILSRSLDYRTTLSAVASHAVPNLADWCSIDIMNEQTRALENLAVTHVDPKKIELAHVYQKKFPRDMSVRAGAPQVLRTGISEIHPLITDEMLTQSTSDPEHLKAMRELGLKSVMIVPLQVRGRTVGVISLVSAESGRKYTTQDLELAEELARRASTAMENSRLYSEVQEAVKARDDFLSICSHELKTPVTSLKLQNQLAARRIQKNDPDAYSPEKFRKLVDTTNRQLDRMSRLIEDMLDVARISSGNLSMILEPVELASLVREVLERFTEQLRATETRLDTRIQDPVMAQCDRYRMEQVVTNLITNAMKYGEGKPIRIELSEVSKTAQLTVSDQGLGIAAENQDRIFNRFERAVSADNISGLGLGLYIVRQILDAHQGSISVSSRPGEGSTFTVTLPLSAG